MDTLTMRSPLALNLSHRLSLDLVSMHKSQLLSNALKHEARKVECQSAQRMPVFLVFLHEQREAQQRELDLDGTILP